MPLWGILLRVYRERLELEWRAAMAVAVAAGVVAATSRALLPFDGWWLLAGFGVVVLVAAGTVLTEIWRRPLPWAAVSTPFRDRELAAAAKKVSHGHHLDPPALESAAIERARHGLRMLPLTGAWQPVLGCAWVVSCSGHGGFDAVMQVLGGVMIVFGLAGLVYVRRVHHLLDGLERDGRAVVARVDVAERPQR